MAAINGFDSFGHYLRAGLIVNQCSTYAVTPTPGCTANFAPASATAASSGAEGPRDQVLIATAEAIRRAMAGQSGDEAPRLQATPTPTPKRERSAPAATATPAPASATPVPQASATPAPAASATPAPAPAGAGADGGDEPLLDYLFGKDAP